MQVSAIQSFPDKNNMKIPLEFEVFPVDERVKFYEFYDKEDKNYNEFIQIAKSILNKYKTECNPKNQKLLKIAEECDKSFKNNYIHGGYKCDSDGNWSKECIASYHDIGYIFDHKKKKCVSDILYLFIREMNKKKKKKKQKKRKPMYMF